MRTTTSESMMQLAMVGMYRSTMDVCLYLRDGNGDHFVHMSPITIMMLLRITESFDTSSSRMNIWALRNTISDTGRCFFASVVDVIQSLPKLIIACARMFTVMKRPVGGKGYA